MVSAMDEALQMMVARHFRSGWLEARNLEQSLRRAIGSLDDRDQPTKAHAARLGKSIIDHQHPDALVSPAGGNHHSDLRRPVRSHVQPEECNHCPIGEISRPADDTGVMHEPMAPGLTRHPRRGPQPGTLQPSFKKFHITFGKRAEVDFWKVFAHPTHLTS